MVTSIDDTKRLLAIERFADLRAFQNLIISNEQKLIDACPYEDIRELSRIYLWWPENLGIIDTVIVQYGIQLNLVLQPRYLFKADDVRGWVYVYQKLIHHELMKHGQPWVASHDPQSCSGGRGWYWSGNYPLNTVTFEGRAHQEQLKGMLEQVGVREMTGLDAQQDSGHAFKMLLQPYRRR